MHTTGHLEIQMLPEPSAEKASTRPAASLTGVLRTAP